MRSGPRWSRWSQRRNVSSPSGIVANRWRQKAHAARQIFEAILYVLRTGCQWKALPKERFGSPVHSHTLHAVDEGRFLCSTLAGRTAEYDEMEGIAWRWQSIDGTWSRPPGPRRRRSQPTDRGKKWQQASSAVTPWSPAVDRRNRAHRHDVSQLSRCSMRSSLTVPKAGNTCAPTRATRRTAQQAIKNESTSAHQTARTEIKKRRPIPALRRVAGWWRSLTLVQSLPKLFVRYEKFTETTKRFYRWPQPLSSSEKQALFTDRLLINLLLLCNSWNAVN